MIGTIYNYHKQDKVGDLKRIGLSSSFLIRYISRSNQVLGTKRVFKHHNMQILVLNLTNMINFHPLEVVGRGSETQLQVGEN